MKRLVVSLVVVGSVLTACFSKEMGAGAPAATTDSTATMTERDMSADVASLVSTWGRECPDGARVDLGVPINVLIHPARSHWLIMDEGGSGRILAHSAAAARVDLDVVTAGLEALGSGDRTPSRLTIRGMDVPEVLEAIESGAQIALSYPTGWSDEHTIIVTAAAAVIADDIWFLGPCAFDIYTWPFASAASLDERGPASWSFIEASLDPTSPEAAAVEALFLP